ncbi:MAG: hypothetical protein CMO55_05285 [Verrucomicrobiales bacterium]|nr:hypothetical protein [Verrucomicrobiales bacterium]
MPLVRKYLLIFLPLAGLTLSSCEKPRLAERGPALDVTTISETTPVSELLKSLGDPAPSHEVQATSPELVEAGKQLIFTGKATNPLTNEIGERISAYFYCSDCHNTVREDSDLANISDPAAKLAYARENEIPLLQGSTFAGVVNRESWYNDDYAEKYKLSLAVRAARSDLKKAIELCSSECSQGRAPEGWEMNAMLAYFWSLQWTIGDLGYTATELSELKRRALNPDEHATLISELKSRYAQSSPATFGKMPEDATAGFPTNREPDLEAGEAIWNLSCMHCHGADGASEHYFGDKEDTWKSLSRKFGSDSKKSVYGYIRLGTHPEDGKQPYMPNYTKERLSDSQIEDLRAFISSKADGTDIPEAAAEEKKKPQEEPPEAESVEKEEE